MVSLLPLLLLMPSLLADEGCVNITITNSCINVAVIDVNIIADATDCISGHVNCEMAGNPCVFQCTYSSIPFFNGSHASLNASVTWDGAAYVFNMEHDIVCTVHECTKAVISPLIGSLKDSDQDSMMQLYYIRNSCTQLFSADPEVKAQFIILERQKIHNIMATSRVSDESSIHYSLGDISLSVLNISEGVLTSTEPNATIQIKPPQLLPQNSSFLPDIWMPVNVLHNSTMKAEILGLVSYMYHSQFQFQQVNISSMVLRIELLDKRLHNLSPPIKIIFRITHKTISNDSWFECRYFDEHDFLWKTHGCETINGMNIQSDDLNDSQSDIICHCNHTTPFAVLLTRETISEVHWKILSYISYIGCGFSAFFTALSLVVYVFNRNNRMDYSTSIHVSLSGALFVLNSTFLLTEWGATVEPQWVCVFVAALMHYSLLCCFTWMAIEALHLYLLLIQVFNTFYKHYLIKLSLAGWGIPGVIVVVSLGFKDFKQFYGQTLMTMADTNQTNTICWIRDDSFFYSLNLVYFTLIFVFNSGILMAVASSICKMKQVFRNNSKFGAVAQGKPWRDPQRFHDSCRNGLTVLGLTCLMGTTWGLAFLGSGYINYPILYLFCILNSTQGFFIFLWICLSAKKQRRNDLQDRTTSTPARSLETKYD